MLVVRAFNFDEVEIQLKRHGVIPNHCFIILLGEKRALYISGITDKYLIIDGYLDKAEIDYRYALDY
jgi:hypothetical protein